MNQVLHLELGPPSEEIAHAVFWFLAPCVEFVQATGCRYSNLGARNLQRGGLALTRQLSSFRPAASTGCPCRATAYHRRYIFLTAPVNWC